jgi:hypothetical protein
MSHPAHVPQYLSHRVVASPTGLEFNDYPIVLGILTEQINATSVSRVLFQLVVRVRSQAALDRL